MAAPRDVRDNEREREVDHDEPERRAGERPRGPVFEDEECAEDPVDRARRTDRHGERPAEQERTGRAGDAGDEVDQQEAPGAERALDDRAAPVEDDHVQRDVEQARVQEHRGDESIPLVLRVDLRPDERAFREQLAAGLADAAAALVDGDQVHEHVERDQSHGRRSLEPRDRRPRMAGRLHRALRRPARGADARMVGALDPDRRERHALLADRSPALRARDERLAARVPVAVGRVAHLAASVPACSFTSRSLRTRPRRQRRGS